MEEFVHLEVRVVVYPSCLPRVLCSLPVTVQAPWGIELRINPSNFAGLYLSIAAFVLEFLELGGSQESQLEVFPCVFSVPLSACPHPGVFSGYRERFCLGSVKIHIPAWAGETLGVAKVTSGEVPSHPHPALSLGLKQVGGFTPLVPELVPRKAVGELMQGCLKLGCWKPECLLCWSHSPKGSANQIPTGFCLVPRVQLLKVLELSLCFSVH